MACNSIHLIYCMQTYQEFNIKSWSVPVWPSLCFSVTICSHRPLRTCLLLMNASLMNIDQWSLITVKHNYQELIDSTSSELVVLEDDKPDSSGMRALRWRTHHISAHCVARAERQLVADVGCRPVLDHTCRVLRQSFGVYHAIERVRGTQCHQNVIAVAFDMHVVDQTLRHHCGHRCQSLLGVSSSLMLGEWDHWRIWWHKDFSDNRLVPSNGIEFLLDCCKVFPHETNLWWSSHNTTLMTRFALN